MREQEGEKKKRECIPYPHIPDTKQTLELVTHPPPALVPTTSRGQTALQPRYTYREEKERCLSFQLHLQVLKVSQPV